MENNIQKKDLEEITWGGWLNEFLWVCAGVNRKVLRQCPTDYAKYAGTGGTILFTALMAMLSGGYAMSFVFKEAHLIIPCLFGVFWGLLIFNLDRFMVNTMYSDGKHTISKDEIKGGLPRIVLAVFLGVVISAPLEIKIFSDKIQSQLLIDQGNVGDDVRNAHNTLYQRRQNLLDNKNSRETQLAELRSGHVGSVTGRVADKEKELANAENRLYEETNGTGVTGKVGYGPAAKQLQQQVDRLGKELEALRKEEEQTRIGNEEYIKQQTDIIQREIEELNRQLAEVDKQISAVEEEGNAATNALTGFCAQMKALNEIAGWGTDLFWSRLCITLLFISIEVIPTLFKMMISAGPYDDMLRAEMYKVKVLADKRISDLNDEINTAVQISIENNRQKLAKDLAANKQTLESLSAAQSEVLCRAIELWKEEEMKKVEENPSAYITVTTQGS